MSHESSCVVYFPNNSFTTLIVNAQTTAAELCDAICRKRHLHFSDYDWFALCILSQWDKKCSLDHSVSPELAERERVLDGDEVLYLIDELVEPYNAKRRREASASDTSAHLDRLNPAPIAQQLTEAKLTLVFRSNLKSALSLASRPGVIATPRGSAIVPSDSKGPTSPLPPPPPSNPAAQSSASTAKRPSYSASSVTRAFGAMFSSKKSNLLLAGYLSKRGVHNVAWKQRWFELKDTGIKYYKTKQKGKSLGEIPLADIVVRRDSGHVLHQLLRWCAPSEVLSSYPASVLNLSPNVDAGLGGEVVRALGSRGQPLIQQASAAAGRSYDFFELVTPDRVFHLKCRVQDNAFFSQSRHILFSPKEYKSTQLWLDTLRSVSTIEDDNNVLDDVDDVISGLELAKSQQEELLMATVSTLEDILRNPVALGRFLEWAAKNHCDENLRFWLEAEKYRLNSTNSLTRVLAPQSASPDFGSPQLSSMGSPPLGHGHDLRSASAKSNSMFGGAAPRTAGQRGPARLPAMASASPFAGASGRAAAGTVGFGLSGRASLSAEDQEVYGSVDAVNEVPDEQVEQALSVYRRYLAKGAESELLIERKERNDILAAIRRGDVGRQCFVEYQSSVYTVLKVDVFPKFLGSAEFSRMLLELPVPLHNVTDEKLSEFDPTNYRETFGFGPDVDIESTLHPHKYDYLAMHHDEWSLTDRDDIDFLFQLVQSDDPNEQLGVFPPPPPQLAMPEPMDATQALAAEAAAIGQARHHTRHTSSSSQKSSNQLAVPMPLSPVESEFSSDTDDDEVAPRRPAVAAGQRPQDDQRVLAAVHRRRRSMMRRKRWGSDEDIKLDAEPTGSASVSPMPPPPPAEPVVLATTAVTFELKDPEATESSGTDSGDDDAPPPPPPAYFPPPPDAPVGNNETRNRGSTMDRLRGRAVPAVRVAVETKQAPRAESKKPNKYRKWANSDTPEFPRLQAAPPRPSSRSTATSAYLLPSGAQARWGPGTPVYDRARAISREIKQRKADANRFRNRRGMAVVKE